MFNELYINSPVSAGAAHAFIIGKIARERYGVVNRCRAYFEEDLYNMPNSWV